MTTETISNDRPGKAAILAEVARLKAAREGQDELPPLPDHLPGFPRPNTTTTSTGPKQKPTCKPAVEEDQPDEKEALPVIMDSIDFLTRPAEQPKVLIEGILHKGSKMILGSGSKSYKTWTLLDLAMSVACGVPWLGMDTNAGKVLFVNFELKQEAMVSRLNAIREARKLEWGKNQFDVWNLRGHAAGYPIVIPRIINSAASKHYDLIVLDPIYKLYGNTDENSAGDVAKLMNELERLCVKSKAAVVFSAHFSKGNQAGKESVDRVSGSGVFARDPDAILSFTKHQEDNAFVVESTLRDFKQMDPFVVKWEYPLLVPDTCLNPGKLKTAVMKKSAYSVEDLLKWVMPGEITTAELKEKVLKDTDMSTSMFYHLKDALMKKPGVTFDKETRKWSYNPGKV